MNKCLTLVYFRVNEVEFKFNETIQPNTQFQIKPKLECKIAKKDDNVFVNLILKINEDISAPVPFDLKVALAGTFKTKEDFVWNEADQKSVLAEAFTILYPYLRSIVSQITLNCNIPAYILPAIAPDQFTENEQVEKYVIKKPANLN